MTTENEVIVTTLLAEKGKKYDTDKKCIGSYQRSIVFLPAEVKPGEIVRVSLHEVSEKKDSRGMVMYFARHAPAPVSEDVLQQLRGEAKVLDTMSNFDEETALTLLRARHGTVIDAWKGYRHYYLDQSGAVYASVFSPAALSLFQYLKRGAGLTEPLLWILGGTKPSESSFYRKRERGEDIDWQFSVPPLSDTEVARLEEKVADGQLLLSDTLIEMRSGALHSEGWVDQLFPRASWPTQPVPDFEGGDDVPDIVEHEYSKGLNGQPLLGYAVFGPSDPAWYRSRNEAEEAHQAAITRLAELRRVWQQRDKLKPLIEELNVRRERLGLTSLSYERDTFKVGWSSYEYTEDNLARFERETADKEESEAKTAMEAAMREARELAEAETAKTEEEQATTDKEAELEAAEARFDIVRYVEGWSSPNDGSEDLGDIWVVKPNGSTREHDSMHNNENPHHLSLYNCGYKVWDVVQKEELVVGFNPWTGYYITQCPKNVTSEQIKTCRNLEAQYGIDPAEGWVQQLTKKRSVPIRLSASRQKLEELADWFNKGKR